MECNSFAKLGQDSVSLKADKHSIVHEYKTVSMICYVIKLFAVSSNEVKDY